jgi:hypothetical protein
MSQSTVADGAPARLPRGRRGYPPSLVFDHRGEVLFLPADPPRLGTFALWQPAPQGVGTAAMVGVVQPDAAGLLLSRPVAARLLPRRPPSRRR